ncbi:unnamed protein product, partial [Rotaria sp. Silwood2]
RVSQKEKEERKNGTSMRTWEFSQPNQPT